MNQRSVSPDSAGWEIIKTLPVPIRRLLMAGFNDSGVGVNFPSGEAKLWIMPAILEGFGLGADFKCLDALYDHKPWSIIFEFGAAGVVLTIGVIVWAVFRKRIAAL